MKGLIITPNYPDKANPGRGAFVSQLAKEFIDEGMDISVAAPKSLSNALRDLRKKHNFYEFEENCSVSSPLFPSFSNKEIIGINFQKLSRLSFCYAVKRTALKGEAFDFYYGKFLFSGGLAAVEVAEKVGKPAFIDLGESKLYEILSEPEKKIASSILRRASGIICVSERLRDEAIQLGGDPAKTFTIPNRADPSIFKPMDRLSCRKLLGLDENIKLVAFVGYFTDRKGVKYLEESIRALNNEGHKIKGIFIGSGPLEPSSELCIFKGRLAHSDLPLWLNSADVFCLPTKAEGNCNAINEAMSVGLVSVISDIPDIASQVSSYNRKVLIDPLSINSIKRGLVYGLRISENTKDIAYASNNSNARGKDISDLIREILNQISQ